MTTTDVLFEAQAWTTDLDILDPDYVADPSRVGRSA